MGKSATTNPPFSFSFGSTSKADAPSLPQANSAGSSAGFSFNLGAGNQPQQQQPQPQVAPLKIGGAPTTSTQSPLTFNPPAPNATSQPGFALKNLPQPTLAAAAPVLPVPTLPQTQLLNANNNQAALQQQKHPVMQLNANTARNNNPPVTSTPPSQSGPTSMFQQQNQPQQFSTPNQAQPQFMPQQQLQQLQQQQPSVQKQPLTPQGKQNQTVSFQPQQQQQQQQQQLQPHQLQQDSVRRVREFMSEFDEFRTNVAKLFSGKDLSKQLLNLSIIKDTKKMEQTYLKLIDEMKVR